MAAAAAAANVYEFCWHVAAGSGKSADPILHREPPLLKHRSNAMCDFRTLLKLFQRGQ
jgi:hypothetical protein